MKPHQQWPVILTEDVVMVSADPILIVNSHDQPTTKTAEIRNDIAMSGLTVSGSSAPGSLVKYAIMASLPSERMDMCHLSDDVKLFASKFDDQTSQVTCSTSSSSWTHKLSVIG